MAWIVGMLASCGTTAPQPAAPATTLPSETSLHTPDADGTEALATPAVIQRVASRWVRARWQDLPGLSQESLGELWGAWLASCNQGVGAQADVCKDVLRLNLSPDADRWAWMRQRFQPWRVESLDGQATGLLTSYYEPVFAASRQRKPGFDVPLYQMPAAMVPRKPWYSRKDIETLPAAKHALRGREIAWLADPVDAMVLHIQGSGRLMITEADGGIKTVRLAYAGTNEHPYKSVGRWLLDQGEVRDASWPGIKAWVAQNPRRTQEMLWSNPRYVFFKEQALSPADAQLGPRGAQGVPLTPGRSIAVDPKSLPYGSLVWLSSVGPQIALRRFVLAQDTGSAIVGAVRADYFAGWGPQAGELAGRLKQPLQMWVLLPQ